MDIKQILTEWHSSAAHIRKPKLGEACDVIGDLCIEVQRLQGEVEYQKNRQDAKEQQYATMLVELHNVVSNYGAG